MSDLWKYLKNLFGNHGKSSAANPFSHEVLKMSMEEEIEFENWKKSIYKHRVIDFLHQEYSNFITNNTLDRSIDFLNTPSSKGFVIHCTISEFDSESLRHLFTYLKERVLTIPYRKYLSDEMTYEKNGKLERVERHYLKPPIVKEEKSEMKIPLATTPIKSKRKFDQKFGNITIELISQNDVLSSLKFHATGYSDHLYMETAKFEGLMEIVLKDL